MSSSSRLRIALVAAGVALVGLGALLVAVRVLGAATLPLALLAVAGAIVVQRPGWALAVALVPAVLLEDTAEGGLLPGLAGFYDRILVISPFEATIALVVIASVLDAARRGEVRTPDPLTLPLMLVGGAIATGVVVGLSNEVSFDEITSSALRPFVVLTLIPIAVVNIVYDRAAIRRVLLIGAVLTGVKSLLGIASVVVGQGFESPNDPSLTYYEPAANWLAMTFLLVVAAVLVDRRRPPLWMLVIGALAFTSLLLSYRRSFWIAAVVGILIVMLVGAGHLRWRAAMPGLAILATALWLTLSTGVVRDVQGPLADRAASLQLARIQANPQDRYRFGERHNVVEDLRENPITGLGLAVPWTARLPLSVDYPDSRGYVHFAALSWWLKLGLLGLISYVWLFGAAISASYRVWREQLDPWLRATGLGFVGTLIGLALAETTATFTGVSERFTVILAAALGLLAAMLADARRAPGP